MSRIRTERIAKYIKHRASEIILHELMDPRIGFVTVTKVHVTDDLEQATIFVSILGSPADRNKSLRALDSARGFIQRELASALETRITPAIQFRYDESVEGSIRVSKLIDEAVAESRAPTSALQEESPSAPGEERLEDGEEGDEDPDAAKDAEDR